MAKEKKSVVKKKNKTSKEGKPETQKEELALPEVPQKPQENKKTKKDKKRKKQKKTSKIESSKSKPPPNVPPPSMLYKPNQLSAIGKSVRESNNRSVTSHSGIIFLIWEQKSGKFGFSSFPLYDYHFSEETKDEHFMGKISRDEVIKVKERLKAEAGDYQILTKENYPNLVKGILIIAVSLFVTILIQIFTLFYIIHPYMLNSVYILFFFVVLVGGFFMYKYYEDVTQRSIRRKKEFRKLLEDANIRYSSRNIEFKYRDDSAYKEIAVLINKDIEENDEELGIRDSGSNKKKARLSPIDFRQPLETDQRGINDEEEKDGE